MEQISDSWADSVDNLVPQEPIIAQESNIVNEKKSQTFEFKVFVGEYKFKSATDIWPNLPNVYAKLPDKIQFMMQDNEVIPFLLTKNNGRKYLIGDDKTLYEFNKYSELVPAFYKDKYILWKQIERLEDLKRK